MQTIERTVDVDLPVRRVYAEWTHFEDFPQFMGAIKEVRRLDGNKLHWVGQLGGIVREWDAEITEQVPENVLAWRSTSGAAQSGRVRFEPRGPENTRVTLQFSFEPEDVLEKVADAFGVLERRVETDLVRFKDFVEMRGAPTWAESWRAERKWESKAEE
jgi:uncharacterized membrane protein